MRHFFVLRSVRQSLQGKFIDNPFLLHYSMAQHHDFIDLFLNFKLNFQSDHAGYHFKLNSLKTYLAANLAAHLLGILRFLSKCLLNFTQTFYCQHVNAYWRYGSTTLPDLHLLQTTQKGLHCVFFAMICLCHYHGLHLIKRNYCFIQIAKLVNYRNLDLYDFYYSDYDCPLEQTVITSDDADSYSSRDNCCAQKHTEDIGDIAATTKACAAQLAYMRRQDITSYCVAVAMADLRKKVNDDGLVKVDFGMDLSMAGMLSDGDNTACVDDEAYFDEGGGQDISHGDGVGTVDIKADDAGDMVGEQTDNVGAKDAVSAMDINNLCGIKEGSQYYYDADDLHDFTKNSNEDQWRQNAYFPENVNHWGSLAEGGNLVDF